MDDLPNILLSAANDTVATEVISELIDNDVTSEYTKGLENQDRVWRLVNKYYTADVRVHILIDNQQLDLDPDSIEAHVIYLSQGELESGVRCAERRAAAGGGVWARDRTVRALLADCAAKREAGDLPRWAHEARALLAVRREPPAAPRSPGTAPPPFGAARGLQRLRDDLHAHTWPNLRRTDQRHAFSLDGMAAALAEWGGEAEGEAEDDDEAELSPRSQRRLVAQSEALGGALSAALAARGEGRAARLARAEGVLLALCRAAGLRPDQLD